jgi:hypothetical protein
VRLDLRVQQLFDAMNAISLSSPGPSAGTQACPLSLTMHACQGTLLTAKPCHVMNITTVLCSNLHIMSPATSVQMARVQASFEHCFVSDKCHADAPCCAPLRHSEAGHVRAHL